MTVKKGIFLFISLLLFTAASCVEPENGSGQDGTNQPAPELPDEIKAWIEYSKEIFLGQARRYDGRLYLLATYGEKPTGGYAVEITEVKEENNELKVTVNFSKPGEGDIVTQALTYPYDLEVIDDPGVPVNFFAEGAESYLPALVGIEELPPVKAGSRWIKIFSPTPGETVEKTFSVEGIANVFEGNVQYRLSTAGGQILTEGFTTGAMGDWGYFSFELTVAAEEETDLLLELYTLSPKDGSKDNTVDIELSYTGE